MPYVTLPTRVAGIPCQIAVTHYLHQKGSGCRWSADSPDDYYGFTECEFAVLDSRGRPAAWLERKLTDADRERITAEVHQEMQSDDRY